MRAATIHKTIRVLAAVSIIAAVTPSFGSPGDVFETAVPVLNGGDPPKVRDIKDGDASVSTQTGALQYSYPIEVPPGRLGIEPHLALSYSSQAPIYGGIAAGWSLSLPEISRDPRQSDLEAQEPTFVPRYVSSMAGGHVLVPVTETADTDVTQTYRAQYDSTYARYEQLTTSGEWRVRTTDGLTWYFGEPDHLGGEVDPRRAVLTRTVDGFGNQVDYYWTPGYSLGGQLAAFTLQRIEYASNPSANLEPYAQVLFHWGDPGTCGQGLSPQPIGAKLEFRDGLPLASGGAQLDSIEIRSWRAPGATCSGFPGDFACHVRTISLSYDADAKSCTAHHPAMRILTSIQESATSPEGVVATKPPVTFAYGPLERTLDDTETFGGTGVLPSGTRKLDPAGSPHLDSMLLDFDGDGRPDRLVAEADDADGHCSFQFEKNSGGGLAPTGATIPLPSFHWGEGVGWDSSEACAMSGQRSWYQSLTDPLPSPCPPGFAGNVLTYRFLDMNSDGLPDLVATLNYDFRWTYLTENTAPDILQGWPDLTCQPSDGACPQSGADSSDHEICIPDGYRCYPDPDSVDSSIDDAGTEPCNDQLCGYSATYMRTGQPDPTNQGDSVCIHRVPVNLCNQYPWLVYWNTGGDLARDGAALAAPTLVWSPVPLESNNQDMSLGSAGRYGATSSASHSIVDIDGDGYLDVLQLDRADSCDGNTYPNADAWWVWRGDGTGAFHGRANGHPFGWR